MFDGLDTDVRCYFVGADWPRFADRVRPHLEKMAAGSGGRYETEDIIELILRGQFHVWLMLEGAEILAVIVTEIIQYPRQRAMRGIGVVGHRSRRWVPIANAALELAAKTFWGCTMLEAFHPPGYERLFIGPGWHKFHILSQRML